MRRVFLITAFALTLTCACTEETKLNFLQEGDSFVLPARVFDKYAKAISEADDDARIALLDKGYAMADSISANLGNNQTLLTFADGIAARFFAVKSPLRNDEIYSLALDREEKCISLEPDDFKRLAWKRGLSGKNAIGRQIVNIPLATEGGDTLSLHEAIDRKTIIFIYGEECDACRKLSAEIRQSDILKKAAADSSARLITIFAGTDENSTPQSIHGIEGWENYIDANSAIHYSNAFDGRMVPSLYATSANRVVTVKGTLDVKDVESYLTSEHPDSVVIKLREGEKVWGGRVADGRHMPYPDGFETSMHANNGNQVQPLLLTTEGRYVWCDNPFDFRIEGRNLILTNLKSEVETAIVGKNLSDAFHYSSKVYFPADGKIPPVEFFEMPQYNTWVELIYNQNQEDVLKYARNIIKNGLPAGIIMIDDTWMEDYGKWVFHPGRFPDPKKMCKELHDMGFKLMLWVCPFVSMDQYEIWAELCSRDAFVKTQDGHVYPVEWWNGISASLDFSNPAALDWFDKQLNFLMDEYGVDGFKFDAGDFNLWPDDGVTYGNETNYQLCEDFVRYGAKYPFNELRAGWKNGGRPIVNRLHDKSHNWEAVQILIPEMMAESLMGYYFACPDMVGGGSFASFLPGCVIDQEIIVRSAQTHALMPMMQFSVAPWRVLDKEHLDAVLKSVKIRQSMLPKIVELMKKAGTDGEPVVTPLEFRYPHSGYAGITDQFMLGKDIMVAPMVYPGNEREVVLPKGKWTADDGQIYDGGQTVTISVPLDRIPYFVKR